MSSNSTDSQSCSTAKNDYDYGCPCCDFYVPSYAILFPWVVELIGVAVSFLLIQTNAPIPFAAVMFLVGTLLGIVATLASTGCCNSFILSTLMWTQIDSNVLLLTILPGLILRDAMEVNFDVFMLALGQLLLLAYPMVLIGTFLTAAAAYYCLPWDWPWSLTLTLGAILGTTDPIAVASVLKRLGAPPRLQLQLSGESTLNDGSAMVFFNVFSQMWFASFPNSTEEEVTVGSGFALFFQNALGGFALGLAFAIGLLITLYQLDKRLEPEYAVLQACAAVTFSYLSYYLADYLRMSGVTASVTCAILAKAFGRGFIQNEKVMINYLALLEFLLNTLLFSLGGAVWGSILVVDYIDTEVNFSAKEEWGWLIAMYLLVMAIRVVQVGSIYPILSRIGLKSNPAEAFFLSFGGMRGAVGIALALSLYRRALENIPDSTWKSQVNSIFFLSGGISLCTLLINGTAAPWVLQWLKLIEPSDRKRTLELFKISAEEFVLHQYHRLAMLPRFHGTSYQAIQKHVPFVTKDCEHPHRGALVSASFRSGAPTSSAHFLMDEEEMQVFSKRIISHLNEKIETLAGDDEQRKRRALEKAIRHIFLNIVYKEVRHIFLEFDDEHAIQNNPEWMRQNIDVLFPTSDDEFDQFASAPAQDYWWNRLERMVASLLSRKKMHQSTACDDPQGERQREYQLAKPMIHRTLAFIGAHRVAEKSFLVYMEHLMGEKTSKDADGEDEKEEDPGESTKDTNEAEKDAEPGDPMKTTELDLGNLKHAVQVVLEESKNQIQIARAKLDALPSDIVRKVQSHVVASILLKKLAQFVAENVQDETLTPKEAQVYLDLIATKKDEMTDCIGDEIPLLSVPTGSSDSADGVTSEQPTSREDEPKKED